MMETKARMRAAVFGICVNLCLFMVKLYVGISTNSISIYVDSLNNALDSVVCIIALVGFWLSVRTSPKYPFGLGRAEDLTGFITAVVIVGTGFGFGYVSLERTLYPAPVWFSVRYAVIIAVTAVVKLLPITVSPGFGRRSGVAMRSMLMEPKTVIMRGAPYGFRRTLPEAVSPRQLFSAATAPSGSRRAFPPVGKGSKPSRIPVRRYARRGAQASPSR